jgi:hypothetical protein
VWIDLSVEFGFTVLYYGVEYDKIWVCSNGFVSFTSACTNANPQTIPSNNTPNAIIAPFWRDLKPNHDGSITYGKEIFGGDDSHSYFVVSWNNVPDANSNPQTFQLLIEERQGSGSDVLHNKIFFQYKTITKDQDTTIGVENQLGLQGHSISLSNAEVKNDGCFGIFPNNEGSRLLTLKTKLTKSDTQALLDPIPNYISGINVELKNTANPYGDWWAPVTGFAADLLIDKAVMAGTITTGAGIAIGGLFVLIDITAAVASQQYSEAIQHYSSAGPGDNESFVFATCKAEELGGGQEAQGEPFDAELASTFEWSFTDPNDADHTLTVTAEACYHDFATGETNTISTSVTLNMYTGYHYLDLYTKIDGSITTGVKVWINDFVYYSPVSINLTEGNYEIEAESPIYRDSVEYRFQTWSDGIDDNPRTIGLYSDLNVSALYKAVYCLEILVPSGGGTTTDPSPGTYEYPDGTILNVTALPDEGFSLNHWDLDGIFHFENPITVTMNSDHTLKAYFHNATGSGGYPEPCPTLFVWNGTAYVDYGVIDIHNPSGEDVVREVPVQAEDVGISRYKAAFRLREGWLGLNFSESVIDQVKLYAINENGNHMLCPLIKAEHSRLGNVLLRLLASDNWKTQILLLEAIDLKFIVPYPLHKIQNFTFTIEGCNMLKL